MPKRGWLCTATTTSWRWRWSSRWSGIPSGTGQSPLEHGAVEVDDQDVLGPDLLPEQEPRIAEQGPVGLAVGDVAGQMVVVPLAPEGAGQEDQLLSRA